MSDSEVEWRDIATAPTDGTVVALRYPDGTVSMCAFSTREISRKERRKLAMAGIWPDYKRWTPTHWRPASESERREAAMRAVTGAQR